MRSSAVTKIFSDALLTVENVGEAVTAFVGTTEGKYEGLLLDDGITVVGEGVVSRTGLVVGFLVSTLELGNTLGSAVGITLFSVGIEDGS